MASALASFGSAFTLAIQEMSHELLVLGVFVVSFAAWKHFGRSDKGRGAVQSSKVVRGNVVAATNKSIDRSYVPTPRIEDTVRQRQVRAQMQAAEQQMLKHLEQREFTRALNLYRGFERDGRDRDFGEELYSAFIQSAIRVGKIDVVERMLRSMKRGNVMPSLGFWQTTLKMLSSRKHYSACLAAHSCFGSQLPTNKVIYSCLINAALETGNADRAGSLLDKYQHADIDAKDYVLFFRAYVSLNDIDKAEAVFRKLGCQTTTLMLNLLLLTCVNGKQPTRALDFLREAHALEKDAEAKIADVISYNTVIKGFGEIGDSVMCFECLQEMSKHNLEPDDITFGALLDACIVKDDMGKTQDIINLLMRRDRPSDTGMCTLFVKGLVRANCLPRALELYDEMTRREEKVRPDIITYSVLIKALVDQHDLQRALKLVADMTGAGIALDDIILTHILEGCRHVGDHALGTRLFEETLTAGVKPSEFTLVTMLKLHGRCGAHKEAYDLVSSWERQHNMTPSVIHYTCLMSGCLRTKNYDQAWEAFALMTQRGIVPDETVFSTLFPGVVAAQQWDRALSLATQAFKATPPVNIPSESLNNALSQMSGFAAMARQTDQLRQLMQDAGIKVSTRNVRRFAA